MNKRGSVPVAAVDQLWPMEAFFNAIPSDEFVSVIRNLIHGTGHGYDDVVCTFPTDLDPAEETFEGAEFWVYSNAAIVVDNPTLLAYIRLASNRHIRSFPEDRLILDQILEHSELG